jgi:putative two-component system response regulator
MPVTPQLLIHKVNELLELNTLRKERPYVEKYQDAISFSFAELVECRDITTGGHLKNTTRYFNILLQEAMVSEKYRNVIPVTEVRDLLRSAMLHDIGKLGITDDILRKESSLDSNEFEYMKTHTTLGKQAFDKIIRETGGTKWLYLAKDMAYCHHERWDGTGYPNGLKGEEIPLYARMLTIADVYDALTSNRAYKKAFSHQKAMEIIVQGKGSYFDPYLVDLFVKANKYFEEMLHSTETIERK